MNTPYDYIEIFEEEYGTGSDEYREAAQRELDFLRSLLPASLIAEQREVKP